eukprot:757947-Hanusia_phi.AAC.9
MTKNAKKREKPEVGGCKNSGRHDGEDRKVRRDLRTRTNRPRRARQASAAKRTSWMTFLPASHRAGAYSKQPESEKSDKVKGPDLKEIAQEAKKYKGGGSSGVCDVYLR